LLRDSGKVTGGDMTKCVLTGWLLLAFVAPVEQPNPQVRDHREVPGAAAQWTIDGREVDSLTLHSLHNTERRKHLVANSSGRLTWGTVPPGRGDVIFENCTRPGEVVYSSDRVAIRFGRRFLVYQSSGGLDWTDNRETGCDFRVIPSRRGFAPVGSGNDPFAIYSMRSNRYLVYKITPLQPAALGLRGQETASGRPPADVAARADFIPVDLFFTQGTVGSQKTQAVYLTIQNIGNVRSSGSQQVMKITIRGQETDFLVLKPVEPGASLRNVVRLSSPLRHCESVAVKLDTATGLKFQVGRGASANADVFANDGKTLTARDTRPADPSRGRGVVRDCDAQLVK
jgi:hypothetical protein